MPEQKWEARRINIIACVEGYRGQGAKGEFVIYNLQATKEDGSPIPAKLSSFDQLPLGVRDVEVSPYFKDGVLKNYTVRLPKGHLKDEVAELRDRVDKIEAFLQGRGEFAGSAAP